MLKYYYYHRIFSNTTIITQWPTQVPRWLKWNTFQSKQTLPAPTTRQIGNYRCSSNNSAGTTLWSNHGSRRMPTMTTMIQRHCGYSCASHERAPRSVTPCIALLCGTPCSKSSVCIINVCAGWQCEHATELPVAIEYHHQHSGKCRVSILSRLHWSETLAWGHGKTHFRQI